SAALDRVGRSSAAGNVRGGVRRAGRRGTGVALGSSSEPADAIAPLSSSSRYIPSLHVLALLTTAATFPLIFMGGLVTSHGAGMSVPDWPNSYGYNMFLFPPRLWIGGILYEHTHRLAGVVVGMLSILLAAVAWKTEPRRWVRWLCAGVLGAVI